MKVGEVLSYPFDHGWESTAVLSERDATKAVVDACPTAGIGFLSSVTARMVQENPSRYTWSNKTGVVTKIRERFAYGIACYDDTFYRIKKALR